MEGACHMKVDLTIIMVFFLFFFKTLFNLNVAVFQLMTLYRFKAVLHVLLCHSCTIVLLDCFLSEIQCLIKTQQLGVCRSNS